MYCWLVDCKQQQKERSSDATLYYLLHLELLDIIAKVFCSYDEAVHGTSTEGKSPMSLSGSYYLLWFFPFLGTTYLPAE